MPKTSALQLSTNFMVIIILSMVIFGLGIFFAQRIHSSAGRKVDQADEGAKLELIRLRNEGEAVALAPERINRQGAVLLMIANDRSVDSNEFGFKVFYDDCFNGDCGAPSPIDWISYPTKGDEERPFEIKSNEMKKFWIIVDPPKDAPSGTYVFNVEVRWDSRDDDDIVYQGLPSDLDDLYSRLKFYVKI